GADDADVRPLPAARRGRPAGLVLRPGAPRPLLERVARRAAAAVLPALGGPAETLGGLPAPARHHRDRPPGAARAPAGRRGPGRLRRERRRRGVPSARRPGGRLPVLGGLGGARPGAVAVGPARRPGRAESPPRGAPR